MLHNLKALPSQESPFILCRAAEYISEIRCDAAACATIAIAVRCDFTRALPGLKFSDKGQHRLAHTKALGVWCAGNSLDRKHCCPAGYFSHQSFWGLVTETVWVQPPLCIQTVSEPVHSICFCTCMSLAFRVGQDSFSSYNLFTTEYLWANNGCFYYYRQCNGCFYRNAMTKAKLSRCHLLIHPKRRVSSATRVPEYSVLTENANKNVANGTE